MFHLSRRVGCAAAIALTTCQLSAQTWTEVGAGSTWTTSETPLGSGPLTRIQGTLAAGQSADLYLVRVDDPATFRVSAVGGANFDTQLWMFDRSGNGIAFNDDSQNTTQSTLTGQFLFEPGTVLIGISAYDDDPLDGSNAELWQDQPYNVERQPDGPGAANAFTHWSGSGGTARPYTLSLAGATFAAEANPVDTQVALAWIEVSNPAPTFPAMLNWEHTPTGERILVNRLSPGRFRVDLPDHLSPFGNVQASSSSTQHTVVVEAFAPNAGKLSVWVNTVDGAGQAADASFQLVYRVGGRPTDRTARLWADQPTAASYTPNVNYSFNGNRGVPTITRTGVGSYTVRLPGLATGATLGGHIQVSPITSNTLALRRVQVNGWLPSGADILVNVVTFNGAGAAIDAAFLLAYTERAGDQPAYLGAGAFVWANNPVVASYTPPASYTDNNTRGGPHAPITIVRQGVGVYAVDVPDLLDAFGVPNVCLYGTTTGNAAVTFWTPSPVLGTTVIVETTDVTGAPADRVFLLQWTSSTPGGTPARNQVVDASCNGSTLRGTSRPVLGANWQLALANLPPTAVLPFTIVGSSDPGLPLDGLGMPGCVLHADLTLLVLFAANPAFTLAVPNSPALVGVTLMAQGGALEPTLNAFGAGVSNAIRGTVGDV